MGARNCCIVPLDFGTFAAAFYIPHELPRISLTPPLKHALQPGPAAYRELLAHKTAHPHLLRSSLSTMATQKDVQDLLRLLTTGRNKLPMMAAMGRMKALQAANLRRYFSFLPHHIVSNLVQYIPDR